MKRQYVQHVFGAVGSALGSTAGGCGCREGAELTSGPRVPEKLASGMALEPRPSRNDPWNVIWKLHANTSTIKIWID